MSVIHMQGDDERIKTILVQYEETDWDFLRRLASHLQTVLVPDCTNLKCSFFFGLADKEAVISGDFLSYRMSGYRDYIEFIIKSDNYVELCSKLLLEGYQTYLYKSIARLEHGELIYEYVFRTLGGMKSKKIRNPNIQGCSLAGFVKKINDNRIQVELDLPDGCYGADGYWFYYSSIYATEDGAGWYFMPESGDKVSLFFPDKMEEHSYLINSWSEKNHGRDPEVKYIRTMHNKEICFTPSKILITNNEGSRIELDDDKGIFIKTNKSFTLSAGQAVHIQSGQKIKITGRQGVFLRQNHNAITIRDGIFQQGDTVKYQ